MRSLFALTVLVGSSGWACPTEVASDSDFAWALDCASPGDTITVTGDIVPEGLRYWVTTDNLTIVGAGGAEDPYSIPPLYVTGVSLTLDSVQVSLPDDLAHELYDGDVGLELDAATLDATALSLSVEGGIGLVAYESTVTLTDPIAVGEADSTGEVWPALIARDSVVTLAGEDGCSFQDYASAGAIKLLGDTQASVTACTFANNIATSGSVWSYTGGSGIGADIEFIGEDRDTCSLDLTDVTSTDAWAEYAGGSIFGQDIKLLVDGSSFSWGTAGTGGGAIGMSGGELRVTDSTFTDLDGGSVGGAVFLYESDGVFEDVSIARTEVDALGGGIYVLEGSLSTTGLEITDSEALPSGLGEGAGGGCFALRGDVGFSIDGTFSRCASQLGGVLYTGSPEIDDSIEGTLTGTVEAAEAEYSAAVAYLNGESVKVTVQDLVADLDDATSTPQFGGAFFSWIESYGDVTVSGGSYSGVRSDQGGF